MITPESRPGALIDFTGAAFTVSFPFSPRLTLAVKALPGRRWDGKARRWWLPIAASAPLEALATQHGVPVAPRAQRALDELRLRAEASAATDAELWIPTLRGELRPFQRAGVAYLLRAKRAFLADEMGLGKTVQALAFLEAADDAYPALVVCPASLKLNWAYEIKGNPRTGKQGWIPHRSVEILSGRRPTNPLFAGYQADITIANYDVLHARAADLIGRGFKTVIFDECHALKTGRAQRTEAAKTIVRGFVDRGGGEAKPIRYRLMLSGTPLVNRPAELMTQLHILNRLDDLAAGGWREFNARYARSKGTNTLVELNTRLRSICYVRRLKRDVLGELPPKIRSTIPFEIDNRSEYAYAEANLIEWIRRRATADADFLASIADLDAEAQKEAKAERADAEGSRAERAEVLVRINKLKQLAAAGKLLGVKKWVEEFLEAGEKLVLFAHHREFQAQLLAAFPTAAHILGDDPLPQRQANVDRFQGRDDCRLIVCSLKAAGVGITLTAASNVAFAEMGWTPADHDQAEDRCHRIGQVDSVTAWYLLAQGTIEEWIGELIDTKRKVVTAATQGEAADASEGILSALIGRLLG